MSPALLEKAMEYEYAFVKAGGLLGAEWDPTGYGAAPPGYGDQRNYELLLEAGFTAPEVVQIMSANGAKVLGIFDAVGSVGKGQAGRPRRAGRRSRGRSSREEHAHRVRHGIGWDAPLLIESVRGLVGIR